MPVTSTTRSAGSVSSSLPVWVSTTVTARRPSAILATEGGVSSGNFMYTESRERGSVYMKFPDETPPSVATMADGRLAVTVVDTQTGNEELTLPADLVVLVTGMVPVSY